MFKQHTMLSSSRIPHHNKCLSHSINSKEDSEEGMKVLVEEGDEVEDMSNVIIVVYWVITKEIAHSFSVHICIVL